MRFEPVTLVSEQALSKPHELSSGKERIRVIQSLTHCVAAAQEHCFSHSKCFTSSVSQKPQSRRDLWHLRMRLNFCFSKLLKMRQHNITERGERHKVSLMKTMKSAFLSLPSSTPGKAETNQEHWEENANGQVSTCLLQFCVPCKALNSLPTALSPPNFTKWSFFKEDQHKMIAFDKLTPKYLLSFLLH